MTPNFTTRDGSDRPIPAPGRRTAAGPDPRPAGVGPNPSQNQPPRPGRDVPLREEPSHV